MALDGKLQLSDIEVPGSLGYWENRAKAAEEAVKSLSMCLAVLCDREENNTVIITDKEFIAIEGSPVMSTFHDKEKGEMRIHHHVKE